MNAPSKITPATFEAFWRLGYRRLVPVIPPTAPVSERSSLFKRVGTDQDSRGKAVGIKGLDGRWFGFDWLPHESDERDCARWQAMGAGVGIKTGQGLLAIDADTLSLQHASLIQMTAVKHFGVLPTRIGNHPKALYLIRVSAPIKYMRCEFGELDPKGRLKDRVEILSDGRQFVAHGIHPKTKAPYSWPFALVPFDQLPIFTPAQVIAFLEELRSILPAAKPLITEGATIDISQASLRGPVETVRKAVAATPNTSALFGTREAYRDYGYAIKAALPDDEDEAFEIYSAWCAKWTDGENDPNVVAADWSRMKPPFRRGANFLYELAEQHAPDQFKKVDAFFDVLPDEPESLFAESAPREARTDTFPISRISDIMTRPPLAYLVGRHIPEVSLGFLYAAPGAGKSFLALDIAMHIAYGRPSWHGDEIRAPADTVVIYIAAEGSSGLRNRINAWIKRRGAEGFSDRLVLIEQTVLFMQQEDVEKLLRTVASAICARPVLVVVDTLSRAVPGAEENAVKDMSIFVAACDRVKERFKCAVLAIHHESKDGKGMRGSGSLQGAGDFVFRLNRKPGSSVGYLNCEKQKDGVDGWSDAYRFDVVDLEGQDTSLVPERCAQHVGPDQAMTPDLATDVLKAMAAAWDAGEPWGVTYRAGERRASTMMVRDFNFGAEKAEALLQLWIDAGDVAVEMRDKKTRLQGYRVLREINPDRALEESIFG